MLHPCCCLLASPNSLLAVSSACIYLFSIHTACLIACRSLGRSACLPSVCVLFDGLCVSPSIYLPASLPASACLSLVCFCHCLRPAPLGCGTHERIDASSVSAVLVYMLRASVTVCDQLVSAVAHMRELMHPQCLQSVCATGTGWRCMRSWAVTMKPAG